ncbi:hypothetical protein BRD18_06220 [Halobacteriales archaeon SW_7_71_33]|nr:MAG: hypothetical protein BRD18_06220 [Halobacteriales archaeon SW_7_71_33]
MAEDVYGMTGLADAYEGQVGLAVSRRRLSLGLGLFLTGAVLTALGVVLASTGVRTDLGLAQMPAWRRAGVLAGLGVPAVVGGVFTILPSSDRVKAAAALGAGVSVLGVALFWYAYPTHWAGYGQNLTLPVTAVYFLGTTTSVWCLFVGIANFKRRNDPGGTITLEVLVGDGESQTVEVSADDVGPDGTVDLGSTDAGATASQSGGTTTTSTSTTTTTPSIDAPGGDATTTTTANATTATGATTSTGRQRAGASTGTDTAAPTDGGVDNDGLRTPSGGDGQVISSREHAEQVADRYCGNCEHFRYVRTEAGMQPYCGFHGEEMDDMEACEDWSSNH